ncbi:MAG TPA: tripartite tricarboxylate transporter substrate binding protein [Ramlibacter sp.]|uniref:Bug family tripartite tricarboxylate transporter substrate binding protein n=1 Tax=Ramlibacter sp. TaxID=1917967 RepID=UPI002BAC675D|nr:tripartite tricarboxylate transporter substrate binding protein [Ramlibacter sp.]HVZ42491.1 tripartite tricarboxylate transporter substrate binding protein [Ramlibacter sp.]
MLILCDLARSLLLLAAALTVLGPAHAQGEAKLVRIVVPAPPGGALDAMGRLLAHKLSAITGEPHVVDNRPGANTQIGTEHVMRSPPDGRTLLLAGTGITYMTLMQKVSFSPLADLAPVIQIDTEQYVLVASPASGVASADDVARVASARPDGLNCVAYPGNSTIACEQLKAKLGGRVTVIPYAGIAPAMNSLLGGHADLMFVNVEPVQKLVESGKLRALAQTRGAPYGVPALDQVWPGFVLEGFYGVLVPAATPAARVRELNRDIDRVLGDPEVIALLHESGQDIVGGPPSVYADTLRRSSERYGELIRKLGLGPR